MQELQIQTPQNISPNTKNLLSPATARAKATLAQSTFTGFGSLVKLLPTGTMFTFLILSPILTNDGTCHTVHKYLSGILIAICGTSCCFSSFTDSYINNEGHMHYGIVTTKGFWPSRPSQDLSSYRLRIGDFVHAFLALTIFAIIALLNPNVVNCFYPLFKSTQKNLTMALPVVFGGVSSTVFAVFPNMRHGIGYPRLEPLGWSQALLHSLFQPPHQFEG